MNLQGKIEYIKNAVTEIKQAITRKNITPTGDLSTYADAIDDIITPNNQTKSVSQNGVVRYDEGYTGLEQVTVSVPLESLTVNPSTSRQTITHGNHGGYNSVTVNSVTASIDSDISANNIRSGVNILGVTGNVIELKGETRIFNANGTYTPSSGKNGITSVTVNVTDTSTDNLIQGNITSVDTNVSSIRGGAFANCEILNTVTLRSNTIVDLGDDTIFENTPIANDGWDNALYSSNLAAKNWVGLIYDTTQWSHLGLSAGGYMIIADRQGYNWSTPTYGTADLYTYSTSWCGLATGSAQGTSHYKLAISSDGYVAMGISNIGDRGVGRYLDPYGISNWCALAYGNGKFVALSSDGYLESTSSGGDRSWTAFGSLVGISSWKALAYGSGKFVALSSDGYIATKTDNGNWTTPTQNANLVSHTWTSLAYGNNKFVAISSNGYISTSVDGENWSIATPDNGLDNKNWCVIAYGYNRFIAISSIGYSSANVTGAQKGVIYVPSGLIDTYKSNNKSNNPNDFIQATQNSNLATQSNWRGLAYGNNTFVAVSYGSSSGSYFSTSTDGINWSIPFVISIIYKENAITFGNNIFVCITTDGKVMRSNDGLGWNIITGTPLGNYDWNGLTYGNGKFVAIGTFGYVSTSTDGETWTIPTQSSGLMNGLNDPIWIDVTYDGTKFVALEQYDGYGAVSFNGIDWMRTGAQLGTTSYWKSLAYSNDGFIAISESGYISTSIDGVIWTTPVKISNLGEHDWQDIIVANGLHVLGKSGYISYTNSKYNFLPIS